MNTYINYLIEANLCLLLFFGAYLLLLHNETNFSFKRIYLTFTVLASLLFPLFTIGLGNSSIPSLSNMMPTYILPEVVIGNPDGTEVIATTFFNSWKIIFLVYLMGMLFLTGKTLFQLLRLSKVVKNASLILDKGDYKIYETVEAIPTFSFFRWIIIGEANQLNPFDKQQIIQHEAAHVKNFHSIDIVLVELARILFWFNPMIYPLKKTLSNIHEYQADEKTVREGDVKEYCSLLARITLQSAGFTLANHFNKSLTVKRIEMMKSMKRKMKKWKIGAVAAIATGLFFTIACQDQVTNELNAIARESTMAIDIPANVQQRLDEMKADNPDGEFVVVEITNDNERAKIDELVKQHGGNDNIMTIEVMKDKFDGEEERGFIIMEMGNSHGDLAEITKQEGELFTIVEERAEPVNGMENLYEFIKQNMSYPVKARENNISGRVFVEFVVEKDGSISNVNALKGIGYGCDEEAVRVVSAFQQWKPARQRGEFVRQRMILPISFNMGNNEVNNHIVAEPATASVVNSAFKIKAKKDQLNDGRLQVNGTIYDENDNPIPNVNIVVEGTSAGTVTDGVGNFSIIINQDQKLVLSIISHGIMAVDF